MLATLAAGWVLVAPLPATFALAQTQAPAAAPARPAVDPATLPTRLLRTTTGDPARTIRITWRTDAPVRSPFAELAVEAEGPKFEASRRVPAQTTTVQHDGITAHYHSAEFTGLMPRTVYKYRVAAENGRGSDWVRVRTASDRNDPFTLLYFGDAQNDIRTHWTRVVRRALQFVPEPDVVLHAGDLINLPNSDSEWGDWFWSGNNMHSQYLTIATPGNHEYFRGSGGDRQISVWWQPQFRYPGNGLPALRHSNYFVDYQGVRFVSLDSNRLVREQAQWLDRILADNPNRWTIVTFHHPVYSTARGRNNPEIQAAWRPILERHNVALVLQGHDHTYGRTVGANERPQPRGTSGTVYVVSVSGPKMYALGDRVAQEMGRFVAQTQLFQTIRITPERIRYESHTASGRLFDALEITKGPDGRNQIRYLPVPR